MKNLIQFDHFLIMVKHWLNITITYYEIIAFYEHLLILTLDRAVSVGLAKISKVVHLFWSCKIPR